MSYPLLFNDVLHEKVWGGNKLKEVFNKNTLSDCIGESWEISCHENGMSVITNGEYKGKTLKEVIDQNKQLILGESFKDVSKFPLLVKILDATDKLSIQVHPDDDFAKENENGELGKCEMWYIIEAKEGAKLVVGTKPGVAKEEFKSAALEGRLNSYIEEIEVKKGDVINIPAGMLHAIEEGIILAEIQQNSDTTYRVYDWNRGVEEGNPRELHIDKALQVIDFEKGNSNVKVKGLPIKVDDSVYTYYIANKYFAFEKIELHGKVTEDTKKIKFYLYTCTVGEGIIKYKEGEIKFNKGVSFMIPSNLGSYSIVGEAILLKSYIPNIEKDFIEPLINAGYSKMQINDSIALN